MRRSTSVLEVQAGRNFLSMSKKLGEAFEALQDMFGDQTPDSWELSEEPVVYRGETLGDLYSYGLYARENWLFHDMTPVFLREDEEE